MIPFFDPVAENRNEFSVGSVENLVWHLYVIRSDERDLLRRSLFERGVETAIHRPTPPYLQPCYAGLGYRAGDLPIAERIAAEALSLPIAGSEADVRTVIGALGCALSL